MKFSVAVDRFSKQFNWANQHNKATHFFIEAETEDEALAILQRNVGGEIGLEPGKEPHEDPQRGVLVSDHNYDSFYRLQPAVSLK